MTDLKATLHTIAGYFGKPDAHLDSDALHVSVAELKAARGKISAEADRVIDILERYPDSYDALRAMQSEGWLNDSQASLCDLDAAARGKGQGGEDVSRKQATLFTSLGRQVAPRGDNRYPARMVIDQHVLSWGNTFELRGADGSAEGSIEEKRLSWTRSFALKARDGTVLANAKEKAFSWGTEIVVSDAGGTKIGTIKERVWESALSWHTQYSILDSRGRVIAESEKREWLDTTIEMRQAGRTLATLHRPMINWSGDNWEVMLADQKALDPRVVLLAAAFKTAADAERHSSQDDDED